MVIHRLSCFSYAFFSSQLNVLASHSFFLPANTTCWPVIIFFTGQLNVLAYLFFLPANSTCWPFSLFFFTGQLNVLAFLSIARWVSSALVTCSPTCSGNTFEVLAIDSNRKLDAVQFLEHVCIPRQNLINLVRPVPSWRPLAILYIFSSQWQYCHPNQVSNLEILWLDLLVVRMSNFSLVFLNLLQLPKS